MINENFLTLEQACSLRPTFFLLPDINHSFLASRKIASRGNRLSFEELFMIHFQIKVKCGLRSNARLISKGRERENHRIAYFEKKAQHNNIDERESLKSIQWRWRHRVIHRRRREANLQARDDQIFTFTRYVNLNWRR